MRKVWALTFGLVAAAAACGGSDDDGDDTPNDGTDGGSSGTQISSSSGKGSTGGTSTSGGSGASSTSGGGGSSTSGGSTSSSSSSGESSTSSSSGESSSGDLDGGQSDASDASEPPGFEYAKFDLNHVLFTGQSNALGIGGGQVLDTARPECTLGTLAQCRGVMFSSGVFPDTDCQHYHVGCSTYEARTSFVPLVEGDTYDDADSYQLETPGTALANEATGLAASTYFPGVAFADSGTRMMVSSDARSGNPYMCLRKGSCPFYFGGPVPDSTKESFDDGIDQINKAKTIAAGKNWSYAVRGVFTIHGEADHDLEANYHQSDFPMDATSGVGQTADYTAALVEWQHDYETAIVAATGQTVPVPMYITQMTNWTWIGQSGPPQPNSAVRSLIPGQQLAAFKANPTKIILVTPTYPFPFNNIDDANGHDKVHLTPTGSRRVGEYFAKAYAQTTFTGTPWKPLYPISVTRNAAVITVQFHVPVAPLVWDVVAVTDPNGHHGFSYFDSSGSPATVATEVIDGDKVIITLSKDPGNAAGKKIRYAYDGVPGNAGGPTSGPRGNLRDSDPTASVSGGAALVNWSTEFDEAVP